MTTGPLPSRSASRTSLPPGAVRLKSGALSPSSSVLAGPAKSKVLTMPAKIAPVRERLCRMICLSLHSFDDAVCPPENVGRDDDAQALCGLEVDGQLDLVGALDGNVPGPC